MELGGSEPQVLCFLSPPHHQHSQEHSLQLLCSYRFLCTLGNQGPGWSRAPVRVIQWVTGGIIWGMEINLNLRDQTRSSKLARSPSSFLTYEYKSCSFNCVIRNSFSRALFERSSCCTDAALRLSECKGASFQGISMDLHRQQSCPHILMMFRSAEERTPVPPLTPPPNDPLCLAEQQPANLTSNINS